MVAREDGAAAFEREAEMIGRVARRVDCRQRPVGARNRIPAFERDVGHEVVVDEELARGAVLQGDLVGGGIARESRRERSGFFSQLGKAIDVVAMRVRQQDVRYRTRAGSLENRGAMAGIVGTRIDDGERGRADEVGVGALEREGTRIVRDDAHDARSHRGGLVIGKGHVGLEFESVHP